jgi:hypothetical protein
MGYTHRMVAENSQTTIYERTDDGLFGWGILAAGDKDYVAIDNQTGAAISASTVGEARAKLAQLEGSSSSSAATARWRFEKLGVTDRTRAALMALRHGLAD